MCTFSLTRSLDTLLVQPRYIKTIIIVKPEMLAVIIIWQSLLFGSHYYLAVIIIWQSIYLAVIIFGSHYIWQYRQKLCF